MELEEHIEVVANRSHTNYFTQSLYHSLVSE